MPDNLQKDVHDIDKRLVHIEAVLEEMKTNHLAHIEKSMESLDAKYTKNRRPFVDGVVWDHGAGVGRCGWCRGLLGQHGLGIKTMAMSRANMAKQITEVPMAGCKPKGMMKGGMAKSGY